MIVHVSSPHKDKKLGGDTQPLDRGCLWSENGKLCFIVSKVIFYNFYNRQVLIFNFTVVLRSPKATGQPSSLFKGDRKTTDILGSSSQLRPPRGPLSDLLTAPYSTVQRLAM